MRIPYSSDSPFAASGNGSRLLAQDLLLGTPGGQKPTLPETEEPKLPQVEPAGQNTFATHTERKSLTADDVNHAKMFLFDDKAKNVDKIQRFKQIHEEYGSPDGNVLDELEFPPMIRNTVDLAIQKPGQMAFAAELLGAALNPDMNDDTLKRRLGILAGTNPEARNLLEMFRKLADQAGDPYQYLSAAREAQEDGMEAQQGGRETGLAANSGPRSGAREASLPAARLLEEEVNVEEVQDTVDALMAEHEPLDDIEAVQVAFGPQMSTIMNASPSASGRNFEQEKKEKEEFQRQRDENNTPPPKTDSWTRASALKGLVPGMKETEPPKGEHPVARANREKADLIRNEQKDFYQGKRPQNQIPGDRVWEAGQQHWPGKKPEGDEYCVIVKRPLDGTGSSIVYGASAGENRDLEHQQIVFSDGSNVGLFKDGARSDDVALTHQYEYVDTQKYHGGLMKQAAEEVQKEIAVRQQRGEDVYRLTKENCQHFIEKVINRAEIIGKEKGISLIIKN